MQINLASLPFMSPSMIRQSAQLRADLQRTSGEMTTGITADIPKQLGGDLSALAGIDATLSRLSAYAVATATMSVTAEAMQTALGVVSAGADQLTQRLLATASPGSAALLATTFADGARFFDEAIVALNTRAGGLSVFSGQDSDRPPLPQSSVLISALETAIAGAATAADFEAAVVDWFNDPAGFSSYYQGGAGKSVVPIAEGSTASLPYTAIDPAVRQSLIGSAMVVLLDRGALSGAENERVNAGQSAARQLLSSSEARQLMAARIGATQEQLATMQSRNAAEKTALSMTRVGLIEADPYDTAVRLKDLEARLDSFYTLTARLSQLRLTDYLR